MACQERSGIEIPFNAVSQRCYLCVNILKISIVHTGASRLHGMPRFYCKPRGSFQLRRNESKNSTFQSRSKISCIVKLGVVDFHACLRELGAHNGSMLRRIYKLGHSLSILIKLSHLIDFHSSRTFGERFFVESPTPEK